MGFNTNMVNLGLEPTPVKHPPVITLTTDFGTADPFAGIMKGVILSICPSARVVDLTHQIPAQDVLAACLALGDAFPYFPPHTIHLAVVDPGVGSSRAALWVRTAAAQFIAPDNGLLSFLGVDQILEVRRLENQDLQLAPVSRTFHGRDLFAPAAAHLARGVPAEALGPLADDMVRVPLSAPHASPTGVCGEILSFDHFGNAITNIRETHLPGPPGQVEVAGRLVPLAATYAGVAPGDPLALFGSTGRLEVSVRNGRAKDTLGLVKGGTVRISCA